MKILKWTLISVASVAVLGFFIIALLMFQPWVFLPHKHIVISLPFATGDDVITGLVPMGEKIEHNVANGNPNGHEGIDFQFQKVTAILSSADCMVTGVAKNSEGTVDVSTGCNLYRINYKEMNSVAPGIHFGVNIKKGQLIGYAGNNPSRQIHWEFSSGSMILDRLCPLKYFDADSKARIENIWANVPANDRFKSQYPDICNGVFKNKED